MNRSYSTHHKDAYADTWDQSAQKEARFRDLFETKTGVKLFATGFGAGSSERIEGSSGQNGFEKAAPDFKVEGTNIVIEVTGPLFRIGLGQDLLVNGQKILYAARHPEQEYWIAHVNGCTSRSEIRMIRYGELWKQEVGRGVIMREQAIHRGVSFIGWAVPPTSQTVAHFDTFCRHARTIFQSGAYARTVC